MKPLSSLDRIADGDSLDGLAAVELVAALVRLGAAQSRIAARLAELAHQERSQTPDRRLLDVHAAAVRLGVSATWVYRRADRLPFARRLGGHLRFDPAGLERWLMNRPAGRPQGA